MRPGMTPIRTAAAVLQASKQVHFWTVLHVTTILVLTINGITKELKARFATPQYTRRDGSAVDPNPNAEIFRARTQRGFELVRDGRHAGEALVGKAHHVGGVVLVGFGQSRDGHVTVSNGLDLEDVEFFGNVVKFGIERFEQTKDLRRISVRTPSGKARDIDKQDGAIGKVIGNGLIDNEICVGSLVGCIVRRGCSCWCHHGYSIVEKLFEGRLAANILTQKEPLGTAHGRAGRCHFG